MKSIIASFRLLKSVHSELTKKTPCLVLLSLCAETKLHKNTMDRSFRFSFSSLIQITEWVGGKKPSAHSFFALLEINPPMDLLLFCLRMCFQKECVRKSTFLLSKIGEEQIVVSVMGCYLILTHTLVSIHLYSSEQTKHNCTSCILAIDSRSS